MPKKVLGTPGPAPYSPGVVAGGFVFVAGQVGSNPKTGETPAGVESQTRNCLERIAAIVEQAGTSMDKVVRVTVYLTDINDFSKMNAVYRTFFPTEPPVRATIGVVALAGAAYVVEIDAIALVE
jgi:2-iminobutanoate/2-iminopropanoate deaminase